MTPTKATIDAITDTDIEALADEGANALYAIVQKRIGQQDGGIAAHFHSDRETEIRDFLTDLIRDYLAFERSYASDADTSGN